MMLLYLSILFPCLLAAVQVQSSETKNSAESPIVAAGLPTDEFGDYNGSDLISWVNSSPQGFVHPSVRIGREIPGDKSTLLGLFVSSDPDTEPIEKGEIIAQVPWDLMIHPGNKYHHETFFSCRALKNIVEELKLGDQSKLAPYVRYLLTQNLDGIPGYWSEPAQEFFSFVLDDALPPFEEKWRHDYAMKWIKNCGGDPDIDPLERKAYFLAMSRDEDTLMVPIYDMANHSNDADKLNTLSYKPTSPGDFFQFVAARKILPGEQIYNSYNRCNYCSDADFELCETFSWNRTPDLFLEFGFVEDFPQTWRFEYEIDSSDDDDDDDGDDYPQISVIAFCLDKNKESGQLEVYWEGDDDELGDGDDVEFLMEHLVRISDLRKKKLEFEDKFVWRNGDGKYDTALPEELDYFGETLQLNGKMTTSEWDAIWQYCNALILALGAAILSLADEVSLDESDYNLVLEMSNFTSDTDNSNHEEL
mmetsp:Transcript_13038/g.26485  ORF Transcript_13038/g.26485 Transcript_13038/m.26485 type:complete len:476 (-) Transcript_13038:96-1523(-)